MPEPGSQPPIAWVVLLAALAALVWQWLRARASGRVSGFLPRLPFWASVAAWILLGLILMARPPASAAARLTAWALPVAGLLAAALIRLIKAEVPRVLAEEAHGLEAERVGALPPRPAGPRLDADDRRLIQRLVSLRRRSALELMVPLDQVRVLRETDRREDALALLRTGNVTRIPVLRDSGSRLVGVIDGRDLIASAGPPAATPATTDGAAELRALCRPAAEVAAAESGADLVEALRANGRGVAAVVDPQRQVLGFVAWTHIFRALLDKPADEVRL